MQTVHSWIHTVSKEDVYTTLKFLLVAVIVLPLLPNHSYGPLDVLNPFEIGLMVVLITGIVAGVADVDAITLSMANLVRGGLDPAAGSIAIILGVASNTVVKSLLALLFGGWQFGRRVAYTLGMMMLGGLATVLLTSLD